MKKHLVLALAALALVACGNTTSATPTTATPTVAPTTAAPTIQTITIDKDDQTELKAACAGSVYHTGVIVDFTTDGTKWAYSDQFGLPSAEYNPGYAEHNLFQAKKNAGAVYNTEALVAGYTKITVKFFAKFESQAAQYLPVVKEGTAADALTAVTADAADPLPGTAAGWSDGSNAQYEYTCTYNVKADSTFFSIGAGAGALYLESIVVA